MLASSAGAHIRSLGYPRSRDLAVASLRTGGRPCARLRLAMVQLVGSVAELGREATASPESKSKTQTCEAHLQGRPQGRKARGNRTPDGVRKIEARKYEKG